MTVRGVGIREGLPAGLMLHGAVSAAGPGYVHSGVQPLPPGAGGRVMAADVGVADGSPLRLFVIGDHGGVKAPGPQNAVSYAMQRARAALPRNAVVSVGDVVYFHGDPSEYAAQFYEPYAHLALPILAIPGNHDGDVAVDDAGNATGRQPLDTFMANFCSSSPAVPLADPHFEYGRHTQTLPWCDWTVEFAELTLIGLYSNVPSGGHLEPVQVQWLTDELKSSRVDKPVIVMLHHPPYSVDAHHGGSPAMGAALDVAFNAGGRHADMVLSGHVHDYQRFTRTFQGQQIPYVVIGNSGYHNLHQIASDATPGMLVSEDVVLEQADASAYGFLSLEVAGGKITGEYTQVRPGTMPDGSNADTHQGFDTFSVKQGQVSV